VTFRHWTCFVDNYLPLHRDGCRSATEVGEHHLGRSHKSRSAGLVRICPGFASSHSSNLNLEEYFRPLESLAKAKVYNPAKQRAWTLEDAKGALGRSEEAGTGTRARLHREASQYLSCDERSRKGSTDGLSISAVIRTVSSACTTCSTAIRSRVRGANARLHELSRCECAPDQNRFAPAGSYGRAMGLPLLRLDARVAAAVRQT
jgi:hypothetical protein